MRGETGLPVVIVAGLHSEARRKVVEHLLHRVSDSVALHHDLSKAADGTALRQVRDASGELSRGEAPLVNDCACCALREDLVPELERLADAGLTRLAVVELWDSVEPRGMAEAVVHHGGDAVRLTNVITAVDPALVLPVWATATTWPRRASRPRPATGARSATPGPGNWVRARPRRPGERGRRRRGQGAAHPTPPHRPPGERSIRRARPAGFRRFRRGGCCHSPASGLRPAPQEADEAGVTTFVWRRHRPFHPERLYQALEELCCAAARSRGRFWLADRPDTLLAWDAAGGALCVESAGPWLASLADAAWDMVPPVRRAAAALDWHPEHSDRCQHLVFTSPGLDRDGLARLLESCLLTDAEYTAGPEAWKRLPAAFDSLLDPVAWHRPIHHITEGAP